MGYQTYSAILCDKCKLRSDVISFRKGTRIEEINIFNIIGFIEKHAICQWSLKITQLGSDIYGLYYPNHYPHPLNYKPYQDGPFYVEDLDINYENYVDQIYNELKEHRERYKKVQVLKDKLGISLDEGDTYNDQNNDQIKFYKKENNYNDQIKLYKEALSSKEIIMNYLPAIDLNDHDSDDDNPIGKSGYKITEESK